MNITFYVKRILKGIIPSQMRVSLKKKKRHLQQTLNSQKTKTSLEDFRRLLVEELGIKAGDRLIVSSSFGNLNADYSPKQAIELLQSIVTEKGLIMMPYYPPMNSDEWADKGEIFDMVSTKSGMGVLTNVFASMEGVYKSLHPTKAVCAWGGVAQAIVNQHNKAKTPFYWDSPYGQLLSGQSKSLCLGLKNIPIFHTFEDVLSEPFDFYYYKDKRKLRVRQADQSIVEVTTYVHNPAVIDHCVSAGDYVKDINPPTYKRIPFGSKYVVVVDNQSLFATVEQEFKRGNSRYRP